MLITNQSQAQSFQHAFEKQLAQSQSIQIASGYIGASEINRYHKDFTKIAGNGGRVEIIHGMGGAEGIRENLRDKLIALDKEISAQNPKNRVWVHKTRYHGKMYITQSPETKNVLLGSSNFSGAGFSKNLELNLGHSDPAIYHAAQAYFRDLRENAVPITDINLPDPKSKDYQPKKARQFDASVFQRDPDFSATINITEKSNLNLFLSKGRLNKGSGIYTPRPFFEVELTLKSAELSKLRPYIPNQLDPAVFDAVTDEKTRFDVNFKRKTNSRSDMRPLHETGIDFMSSPRKELGHYIKGKLMRAGVLAFGEPVTEDVLFDYGKTQLDFYFLDATTLYLKF